MLTIKRKHLSASHCFGIGPYMASITHNGAHRSETEDFYWKHIRKPLLRKLVQGAHECAPNLDTFADAPEAAIKQCYESLIVDLLHLLQDELGGLIVVIREEEPDCE